MAKGKMHVEVSLDDTAKSWRAAEGFGQFIINILTAVAYVICILWILGMLPF